MQALEKTKEEVTNKAVTMSDFLRIEYLELCTENIKDLEVLRYCYEELAKLYEKWVMYSEALKYLAKLNSLTISKNDKFKIFEKEIEILIKSGNYDNVLSYYKEIVKITNTIKEYELKRKIVELFKMEANKLESGKKYSSLSRLYEKLIPFLADIEKKDIMKRLLTTYEKLGKVREFLELEKSIERY